MIKQNKGNFSCKKCGKKFDYGRQLGGHAVFCTSKIINETCAKLVVAGCKRKQSEATKAKIRASVNAKIAHGTWHNSFSKARTHLYKGISFYGKWEVAYAQYLDKVNIKWRRPTEIFPYEFEGTKHHYTPDFYLEELDLWIEIKGYETEKDRVKWVSFPYKLQIIFGKDLFELGLIKSFKQVKKL